MKAIPIHLKEARPTFGQLLRALRFRFNWSGKHGCFIRMRHDGSTVAVQLHPAGLIPNSFAGKGDNFLIWWDHPEGEDILAHMPAIKNVRSVKKAIQFSVDAETGERV